MLFCPKKIKMEIKIISTQIIKPSSPTPDHLRTHKHFIPAEFPYPHFPIVFFYSTKGENPVKVSNHLKNSLSKTLTYYYPLAGQTKDKSSIDCNDQGVVFIETQVVVGEMSDVLEKKDHDVLKELVPSKGKMQEIPTTYGPFNLIVQVNYFGCSGIAICTCFNHYIADGNATAYFLKCWSEVARGVNDIKNVVPDYSHIHPPHDTMVSLLRLYEQNHYNIPTAIVAKSFTFDSRKIAALKEKIGNGPYLNHPTRFEAIAALISGTLIKNIANSNKHELNAAKQYLIVIPINLRDKVNPPLPQQSLGNLVTVVIAKFSIDQKIDYNIIAAKIRESVSNAVDQYKRNIPGGGFGEGLSNSVMFHISDVSKFPYYEADFGWGKPLWLSFVNDNAHGSSIEPFSDGEGVEILIGLSKEEIEKFEQDPEIRTWTQSSISERQTL